MDDFTLPLPLPLPLPLDLELPVIDFSEETLKPGSSKWEKVTSEVRKALEDYGCFQASFDKVSMELKKSVYDAMKEVFDLPIQTKQRNVSSKPYHGYLSHNLYESLGIDDADDLKKVEDFTNQLWLDDDHGNKKGLSKTMQLFSEELTKLDVMVRRMIMESFGLEKYIDEHLNSTNYLLRMMKYDASSSSSSSSADDDAEEIKMGLRSHTDKNILTILYQPQVDGLEVKTRDDKWIKVKPSQDCFIVMPGDSLCAFLNGRLSSPYHQVMMKGKVKRYTAGLFSVPKAGHIIDSPEELIDEEHPRQFKPYDYINFLNFFYSEAGRKAQSALHAYAAL